MVTNVLMSIRLPFASSILTGEKKFEFRRVRPRFDPGSRVWMYATKPTGAVIGVFEAGDIVSGQPAWLWSQVEGHAGLSEDEFRDYFRGRTQAHAIMIREVQTLDPTLLPEGSTIPQSYRFLRGDETARLALSTRAAS